MEHKPFLLIFLFVLLLGLGACNSAGGSEPEVEDSSGSAVGNDDIKDAPPADKISVDNCAEAGPGTHQLVDAAQGICFLYPDNYDVFQGEDGSLTLYVRSLLNTEAPLASIHFASLDGRSIQEVIPDYPSDAELAAMSLLTIELGSEQATVLDNLPGQDTNRRIIALHDGLVVDIMVARIGADYGSVGEQAEALYEMITNSFQFIGIEPEAPLLAGPECPDAPTGTTLFTNAEDGFCLLLPDGYAVDDSLTTESGGGETAVYVNSPQDVTHARLFITVEDAGSLTLDEVTTAKRAELESAIPGFEAIWSFGYMMDGVPANQIDQVPGQDLSRQVVAVHNGILYTLTFVPDDPAEGSYTDMQTLYDMVMDSFSFTFTDRNGGVEVSPSTPTGSIFGWVWHDVCQSGKEGEPSLTSAPEGCIESTSPPGSYQADGRKDPLEPVIPEIVVRLGQGACPAAGLAEVKTIETDISYSFAGLNAGTYCVSISPLEEANFSLLIPGIWTYPEMSEGTIGMTVTLEEGQNVYDINFGWDHQFLP